jgi:hypothetical protein
MVQIRRIPINLGRVDPARAFFEPGLRYTKMANFSGIERGGDDGE